MYDKTVVIQEGNTPSSGSGGSVKKTFCLEQGMINEGHAVHSTHSYRGCVTFLHLFSQICTGIEQIPRRKRKAMWSLRASDCSKKKAEARYEQRNKKRVIYKA